MEGSENDAYPFPSKGNQAWNIPRATKHGTFHWAPSKNVSPLTSNHGTFKRPPNFKPSIGHQLVVFLHLLASSFL
jgi:hypothetical protein